LNDVVAIELFIRYERFGFNSVNQHVMIEEIELARPS
jgi:hypothetical protein